MLGNRRKSDFNIRTREIRVSMNIPNIARRNEVHTPFWTKEKEAGRRRLGFQRWNSQVTKKVDGFWRATGRQRGGGRVRARVLERVCGGDDAEVRFPKQVSLSESLQERKGEGQNASSVCWASFAAGNNLGYRGWGHHSGETWPSPRSPLVLLELSNSVILGLLSLRSR